MNKLTFLMLSSTNRGIGGVNFLMFQLLVIKIKSRSLFNEDIYKN